MLVWFRKKQSVLAPGVAAVLLAGMFSLVCRDCLAGMNQKTDFIVNGLPGDEHCSHTGTKIPPQPAPTDNPCIGIYDCDDNPVATGDKRSIAANENTGYPDFRFTVPVKPSWNNISRGSLPYTIGEPYKPDRACYLPLERNCVLLK